MRILYNAKIFTPNPQKSTLTAILIDDDRILAVGNDDEILAEAGLRTDKINLAGKTVWPGLTDAHIHLQNYALALQRIDCETPTRQECLQRVAERALRVPADDWILGHGWNQNIWAEGPGNAQMLDRVAPHNPVYLTTKSLHAGWANSAALRLAGINSDTSDPIDGKIERDAGGKPTGILFETAVALIESILPKPKLEQTSQAILAAQTEMWKMGLTGAHDFDQASCFSALETLDQSHQLHLRMVKSIPLDNIYHAIAIGLQSGFGSKFLRIGSVKMFADGALGPRTAAMLKPYENELDYAGLLMLDAEQIAEFGRKATYNGLSIAIHAIGDRANHEVINGYAQIRIFEDQQALPHLRHRIEHVQLLHPEDLDRLTKYDIIASMQPIHATSDMLIADLHWGKRAAFSYTWQSLLGRGVHLAFGSDAPVESPNPFWGLHAAVTRRRADGSPGAEGWYPEQRLTLLEALNAYTQGAAYAAGLENRLGKLEPGYFADLIVLDLDPFSIPAQEIYRIKPEATMVGGKWVWQSF
ncbi:MAG TPA: amidohydrolase family protein [Anaerolineaceae bacterium]|nr:amidohydrolase family protein [Anaerolineaceae bacterium]